MELRFFAIYTVLTAALSPMPGFCVFLSSNSSSSLSRSLKTPGSSDKTQEHGGSRRRWLSRHIVSNSCQTQEVPNLHKRLLKTLEVSCNDGTPAGYYIRRSHGSSRWIVFLEGGWYCFDHISCSERFRVMGDSMSSRNWPKYRSGTGILSWDPEENPYHFHSNVVYIPYCSSDSWSGTRNKTSVMDFSFMGSLILDKIFKELLRKGMRQSSSVILAGTSAGGTGVLINLDRISDLIHAVNSNIHVMGIVDAGWFLDNEPFKAKPCRDSFSCSPMAGIQRGARVWEPRLPINCTAQYNTEIWRCFFGHRVYPSVKSPVYIIQNMYDAAQIQVNNVFDEALQTQLTSEQWRYLLNLGEEMKETLQNLSAVFSPGCVAHEVLIKPEWHKLSIDGVSLPQSIHCWELSHTRNSSCPHSSAHPVLGRHDTQVSDEASGRHDKGTRWKNDKQKWRNGNKDESRGQQHMKNLKPGNRHCRHQLIDQCPWPHCNCSCMKSRWEVLSQAHQFFLQTLAAVMGIDPAKMIDSRLCGS